VRGNVAVTAVQLGSPRTAGEGLRIGTVRRPPRGVKKAEYASRDYYDVWLPELAPSEELRAWVMSGPTTGQRWKTFVRRYRREMAARSPARLLALLRALARTTNFSIGCYCMDESRCHRSVLLELLTAGSESRKAKKSN
jgi:uncharacterized protein YeaO (DUF488 family)